jgi:hypothetical protein
LAGRGSNGTGRREREGGREGRAGQGRSQPSPGGQLGGRAGRQARLRYARPGRRG